MMKILQTVLECNEKLNDDAMEKEKIKKNTQHMKTRMRTHRINIDVTHQEVHCTHSIESSEKHSHLWKQIVSKVEITNWHATNEKQNKIKRWTDKMPRTHNDRKIKRERNICNDKQHINTTKTVLMPLIKCIDATVSSNRPCLMFHFNTFST